MLHPAERLAALMLANYEALRDLNIKNHAEGVLAGAPDEAKQYFKDEMLKIMPTMARMTEIQAGVLEKHYTTEDMFALIEFYASPLGQKALTVGPKIAVETNQVMTGILRDAMPALLNRLLERHKAPEAPTES